MSRLLRILVGASLVIASFAIPRPSATNHATHRIRSLANGAEVKAYSPPSRFEVSRYPGRLPFFFLTVNDRLSAPELTIPYRGGLNLQI